MTIPGVHIPAHLLLREHCAMNDASVRAKGLAVRILRLLAVIIVLPTVIACFSECCIATGIWFYAIGLPLNLVPMFLTTRLRPSLQTINGVFQVIGCLFTTLAALVVVMNAFGILINCVIGTSCVADYALLLIGQRATDISCNVNVMFGMVTALIVQIIVNVVYAIVLYGDSVDRHFA